METRLFSFGIGQVCPFTGDNLRNCYVLITAPTGEQCREVMFATFGRDWSMEYLPGTPRYDKAIAEWTEHARIVIGVDA